MPLKNIVLAILLSIPFLAIGQYDKVKVKKSIREATEESTFLKAQEYRTYLGLTLDQSITMEKILNKYNRDVRELVKYNQIVS